MYKKIAIILTLSMLYLSTATASTAEISTQTPLPQALKGRMYGIGSVSKVFTAAAVMKLVDQGKLELDEPIVNYVPDFTMRDGRYVDITARMLLNHSAGFMGSTGNNGMLFGNNSRDFHDNFLKTLSVQSLKAAPGEFSVYCNDGFTMAEILVEYISGMTFTDFIDVYFSQPLGLKNIKTPQSDFDRDLLAQIYQGASVINYEALDCIGSGGIYSSMDDLVRYSTIFMDAADGSILSKHSVEEMAKDQHQNPVVPEDWPQTNRYGLGWDCVENSPFKELGVKAIAKGGDSIRYHTELIVLPEYNLAAAVSASGFEISSAQSAQVAQEIILAVLIEEGLVPPDSEFKLPALNAEKEKIPENIKANAGFYDAGIGGIISIDFTDDDMIAYFVGNKNERGYVYNYNSDGEFIGEKGEFLGKSGGTRGASVLGFIDGYLVQREYIEDTGLSCAPVTMPIGVKLETNDISPELQKAWDERSGREYLIVSEKYSSAFYAGGGSWAKTEIYTDKRVPGYFGGQYGRGPWAKITDESTGMFYQIIPTVNGRDTEVSKISVENGIEYLNKNNQRFINAEYIEKFSELNGKITIADEAIWVGVDGNLSGRIIRIETPENASWFVYDSKMNCIAMSLEKNPRDNIILPDNGRLCFVGETGAEFILKYLE